MDLENIKEIMAFVKEQLADIAVLTWEIMQRQVYVDAGTNWLSIIISASILFYVYGKWIYPMQNDIKADVDLKIFSCLIFGCCCIALLIVVFAQLSPLLTAILNPDYATLQKLMSLKNG